MNHVDDPIERLGPVDWDVATIPSGARSPSRVRLFLEYVRRMAWWADCYQVREKWPFFDLAACVNPDVRASDTDVEQLTSVLDRTVGKSYIIKADLPHPFEPLIIMYERGGGFMGSKAGGWEVDLNHIWHRKIENHFITEPQVSLDPAALDALDAADS